MSDFKERLIEEHYDLEVKLNKLTEFMHTKMFAELDNVNFGLLMVQHSQMTAYLDTLNRRIEILVN